MPPECVDSIIIAIVAGSLFGLVVFPAGPGQSGDDGDGGNEDAEAKSLPGFAAQYRLHAQKCEKGYSHKEGNANWEFHIGKIATVDPESGGQNGKNRNGLLKKLPVGEPSAEQNRRQQRTGENPGLLS